MASPYSASDGFSLAQHLHSQPHAQMAMGLPPPPHAATGSGGAQQLMRHGGSGEAPGLFGHPMLSQSLDDRMYLDAMHPPHAHPQTQALAMGGSPLPGYLADFPRESRPQPAYGYGIGHSSEDLRPAYLQHAVTGAGNGPGTSSKYLVQHPAQDALQQGGLRYPQNRAPMNASMAMGLPPPPPLEDGVVVASRGSAVMLQPTSATDSQQSSTVASVSDVSLPLSASGAAGASAGVAAVAGQGRWGGAGGPNFQISQARQPPTSTKQSDSRRQQQQKQLHQPQPLVPDDEDAGDELVDLENGSVPPSPELSPTPTASRRHTLGLNKQGSDMGSPSLSAAVPVAPADAKGKENDGTPAGAEGQEALMAEDEESGVAGAGAAGAAAVSAETGAAVAAGGGVKQRSRRTVYTNTASLDVAITPLVAKQAAQVARDAVSAVEASLSRTQISVFLHFLLTVGLAIFSIVMYLQLNKVAFTG